MKMMSKDVAVAKLVGRYAKHLRSLDAKGLRAEWDAVLGDDYPTAAGEAVSILAEDYEDWMGALDPLELEAVWEELLGEPVRIGTPRNGKPKQVG
jgi:hypothetical protein